MCYDIKPEAYAQHSEKALSYDSNELTKERMLTLVPTGVAAIHR